MGKKVAISIPVHEQPLVIENQLLNIQKFVPNSVVVLHSSADSNDEFHQALGKIIKKLDGFAYLNPKRFHTHSPTDAGFVTGLSTVHASNFEAIKHLDFDLWAIDTSNDMFVRAGISEQVFDKYSCCFHVSHQSPEHYPFPWILKDISKFVTLKTVEKGSQEGSVYPKHVFQEVAKIIPQIGTLVKAEEMYLPCLAFNLFPELYQVNSGSHYVFHNPAHYAVTREDIHQTQYGEKGLKFAVKRVPRIIDHEIRVYINQITQ